MDLDRWRDRLRETGEDAGGGPDLGGGELASILKAAIRKSRRAVARAFLLEIAGVALIYALAGSMILIFGPLQSFQLKIIILSAAGIVPVFVMFGRYFAAARPDLGRPIAQVLDESVRRLKSSLRIYRLVVLIVSAAMAAALWTDAAFRALSPGWKWGASGYILAVAFFSFPYLRALYGRRLRALESLSREAHETTAL